MNRRGLTLVETLAAAALLAVMAAAVAPLLRDAASAVEEPDEVDMLGLGQFADEVAAVPERHGIDVRTGGPWSVLWKRTFDERLVEVTRLLAKTEPERSAWLVFRCGTGATLRWVAVEASAGEHEP
jgi:prepilin-type N-terminal cleavage/methylation domain-containing protein